MAPAIYNDAHWCLKYPFPAIRNFLLDGDPRTDPGPTGQITSYIGLGKYGDPRRGVVGVVNSELRFLACCLFDPKQKKE